MDIDADLPRIDLPGTAQRPRDIVGPDRSRQPLRGAVAPHDQVVLFVEPQHGDDRAEHFFLFYAHAGPDFGKQGRTDEMPRSVDRGAFQERVRAFTFGDCDLIEHPRLLPHGNQRAKHRVRR